MRSLSFSVSLARTLQNSENRDGYLSFSLALVSESRALELWKERSMPVSQVFLCAENKKPYNHLA